MNHFVFKSKPKIDFMDLTGQKFSKLTVVELIERGKKSTLWKCKCECGGTKVVSTSSLNSENVKSCGCLKKTYKHLNLVHLQFGKLQVMKKVDDERKGTFWLCKCICDNEKVVSTSSLRSGQTRSCGCIKKGRKEDE